MSQKLPANGFKWVENTSQFNEDFMKNYNKENDERYFLEVDFHYPEKLHDLHNNLLPERIEIEKSWKTYSQLA